MKHYIQKVCPVLLRQRDNTWQILAFRHPKAGTQLIKGTIEVGEPPEVAVLRELAEESGLVDATVVEKIGELSMDESEQQWHIFLCQAAHDLPEEWDFFTTDGGGNLFHFFWHSLDEAPDKSWHAHFRLALEWIRHWQQGKAQSQNGILSTLTANKALVRRHFVDVLQDGSICDTIYTPALSQAIQKGVARLKSTWSDACYMTVDDMLAEEDRVMVRWTFYGTQQGEFAGLPATHRKVRYGGVNIFRIADGKIVEIWDTLDGLSLWQQLGVLPEIKDAIEKTMPLQKSEKQ